jgi:uncharacterized protein YfaS (alpha-2-macroglobulin family)
MRLTVALFIFLTISCKTVMAQFNYDAHWKKVEELDGKGLPQSALKEVEAIYGNALKQKEEVQLLKTFLYRIKYTADSGDESAPLVGTHLAQISRYAGDFSAPVKAVMQSMKGELLWRYLQQNRYRLYGRTTVQQDTSSDVGTWGIDRLHQEVSTAYEASLVNKTVLQQTGISQYKAVLVEGAGTRSLRPTLYDLLAHRALEYFKSGENNVIRPADQFELTDPAAFAVATVFAQHRFITTDTAAVQYKAILLLQELMRFHANDKTALLDLDVERTNYMQQIAVMLDKEQLYVKLLKAQEQAYSGEKEVTQVIAQLAQYYLEEGAKTDETVAEGITPSQALLKAKALCDKGIQLTPASRGGLRCADILGMIRQQDLRLESELVNLPGVPFRSLVNYKNTDKIYLRVVSIDENFKRSLRKAQQEQTYEENKYWQLITGSKPLKSWEQPLPGSTDYRQHATEIKIDALPVGQYMIIASAKTDFSLKENIMAVQFVHVSVISYISNNQYGNMSERFYVLHRQTGKPLAGVTLKVWASNYGDDAVKAATTPEQTLVTDKDGAVSYTSRKESSRVRYEWINGNDRLFLDDYKYMYYYNSRDVSPDKDHQTFLFADRAIYRPGQTVFFKGIVINSKVSGSRSSVLPGLATTVYLYNANGQQTDSLQVTSNEYGSYSGKFRLPEGQLNGEFRLVEGKDKGQLSFSVEEYKRPKFYVEFDKVKGSYRVNDSVKITGKALAYAGNNIDGAKVKYRIVRQARFPYPWLMWKRPFNGVSREIQHGEMQTAADGSFTVTFPAVPDLQVAPALKPIFSYSVQVDITDLNGETRSGNQTVSAGYQALQVLLTMEEQVLQKDLDTVKVLTQNLNGVFEPAKVTITLSPVIPPARLLHNRYWSKPDQFVIPQDAYEKDFLHDVYNDEDKPESWKRETAVLTQSLTTIENGDAALTKSKLLPGWYELKVSTTDKYGEEIVQKKVFELVDLEKGKLSYPVYSWKYADAQPIEPGQKSLIRIGSSADDVHVLQFFQQSESKEILSTFAINNGVVNKDYTATVADRGNVIFQYAFVKDNRVFIMGETVSVPWTNKQLDVTIASHRDKLLPGEKEKWKVNIKGYKGEQVAAEMVGAMYDASLDAFRANYWEVPSIYPSLNTSGNWNGTDNFREIGSVTHYEKTPEKRPEEAPFSYDELNWFGGNSFGGGGRFSGLRVGMAAPAAALRMKRSATVRPIEGDANSLNEVMFADSAGAAVAAPQAAEGGGAEAPAPKPADNIQPRTNFNETAFFLPELHTDQEGNISFEFTMPEALTRWRFMSMSHTKAAAFGYAESTVMTQKPLMVQPNAPRFIREGDRMDFTAKISNLADSALAGEARLELLDAATMQPVDGWFQNLFPVQHFKVEKGQSTVVTFPIQLPFNFNSSLLYRVVAQSGVYSDGEENALPVLTNTMLVTETLPMSMRGDGTRTFTLPKLLHSDSAQTLQQHAFTVEFTGNPAWYAVQALPYLMDYPYECAEQVFNRYYANTLATYIANALPGVKNIFEKWRTEDTAALLSNLQKNEELKAVLLQETPWVMEAKNEAEQKKRIALLFDLQRMSSEKQKALEQLAQKQLPDGSFPWFAGMSTDRFITQYIVAGIGRLQQVNALQDEEGKLSGMLNKAVIYLDKQMNDSYYKLKRSKADMSKQQLSYIDVHYLYTRSLLKNIPVNKTYDEAFRYYQSQAKKFWLKQGISAQVMLAIALQRNGDATTAKDILRSLKERATVSEEMGMYWKEVRAGYWWYQAPVETQALLIEAFQEIAHDTAAVSDMKTWLLKNKQTNNWSTTKSTADACYAMLLGGNNWLAATPQLDIKAGNAVISNTSAEAGTGYFKKRFNANEVKPAMGNIAVTVKGSQGQPAWGAAYWQYFEQLDKITSAETPLKLEKALFIERNTNSGPVLTAIADGNQLKVGDKVKVRVVMKVDREMEYVHLKDMRAACFEPENVISANKWQNGVGYYESTKDASTDFFFSYLPKGTYVFEYVLFVTHQGNFSNGISTAQCMYAPEFSAHSEGVRVKVVE